MYNQLRGPERLFRIGQWAIAILFAYFLTQVGSSIIEDLPMVREGFTEEQFIDQKSIDQIEAQASPTRKNIEKIVQQIETVQAQLTTAQEAYEKEKTSFNNWKETRASTNQSDQNPEVVSRAKKLDEILERQRVIEDQLSKLQSAKALEENKLLPYTEKIDKIRENGNKVYIETLRKESLKIFALRLAFVLPILILALWLFRKYRKSERWPFVWGFIFFALFAFFFELVPYLPSFGGYIRWGVGVILTYWVGNALINALRRYIEEKQKQQAAPQEERTKEIAYEKALLSMNKNQCPSCERSISGVTLDSNLSFCMHCGLKIFHSCDRCNNRYFAFYPFCPSCGSTSHTTSQPEEKNDKTNT